MAFAPLTWRESPRGIEACLRSVRPNLYQMGFRGRVSRSTLAGANESYDWSIWADLAQALIGIARPLYAGGPIGVDWSDTVYALDSATIDLCLSLFRGRASAHKAAVKLHTLLDLRGSMPAFIYISNGQVHDVKVLDEILRGAGSFYVMDRGYLDFKRLYVFALASAFFPTRTKKNVQFRRRRSLAVAPGAGVLSDHIVASALGVHSERLKRFQHRVKNRCVHLQPTAGKDGNYDGVLRNFQLLPGLAAVSPPVPEGSRRRTQVAHPFPSPWRRRKYPGLPGEQDLVRTLQ